MCLGACAYPLLFLQASSRSVGFQRQHDWEATRRETQLMAVPSQHAPCVSARTLVAVLAGGCEAYHAPGSLRADAIVTNNPPASSAGTSSSSPDFKVGPLMEQNWTSPQQLPPACRVVSDGFLQLQCSAHSAQPDGQSTGHRDSCGLDLQHLYKVGCCARYASGCCHCHHPAPGTGCNYMSLFAEDTHVPVE